MFFISGRLIPHVKAIAFLDDRKISSNPASFPGLVADDEFLAGNPRPVDHQFYSLAALDEPVVEKELLGGAHIQGPARRAQKAGIEAGKQKADESNR